MEVTGLVVGLAGLAGLFSTCVDCYQLIKRGAALDKDYRILETKFNNQELRFSAWGRAVGLLDGQLRDDRLSDPSLQSHLYNTLSCIKDLFQDENDLKRRYGLGPCATPSQALLTTANDVGVRTVTSTALGSFFSRKKQQRSTGLAELAAWAVLDRDKFVELIQHLKDFNDDLESMTQLTGVPRRQRVIVEYEIEEVDDIETLEEIAEAALEHNDLISDTASRRLSILHDDISPVQSIRASLDTRRSFHTARTSFELDFNPPNLADNNSLLEAAGDRQYLNFKRNNPKAEEAPRYQKLKCVAVGDAGCGKTQLLTAFVGRITFGEYIPTVFDNYSMRCSTREDNQNRLVELGLFDTAGQEDLDRLLPLTFAEADVFILCFPADASTERLTASIADRWLPEIRRTCPNTPFVVAAIRNDWDDADDIPGALLSIDPEERVNFARTIGATGYFDIWPCTRIRVDQLLKEVIGAALTYNEAQKRSKTSGKRWQTRRRSLLSRLLTIRE